MTRGVVFRSIRGNAVRPDDVAACLSTDGIVLFAHAHRTLLTTALASWAEVQPHPHTSAGAFTVIEPSASATRPGGNGFSREAVAPHTDRALIAQPPALVAVLVERPATAGGQALLIDVMSDWWFRLLMRTRPTETCVWLHAADGGRWPILESSSRLTRLRFRDDDLAQPRRAGVRGRVVRARLRALASKPMMLRLGAAEGYLVHNHRILHGRTAFVGYRRAVRLLADVQPDHPFAWLNDGFALGGRFS